MVAYALIFSLLWQDCLWATGRPLYLIEEELPAPHSRSYGHSQVNIVEPGLIQEDGIHNVFEDLLLPQGNGIVFKSNPQAQTIYNRIYSDTTAQFSGIIASELPTSMVIGNHGGLQLTNPEFLNIKGLTLAAGNLARTNRGMAYSVDQGKVTIHQTLIAEKSGLERLGLAGKEVHINQSLLNTTDGIDITVGSHIGGLWESGRTFVSNTDNTDGSSIGISLDKSSTLRAKRLFFQSLDDGASLRFSGALDATDEDIIIKARGDIYLNQLASKRNLYIETTGNVYFEDQAYVEGLVHVNAKGIHVNETLTSGGNISLECLQHINITGLLLSKNGLLNLNANDSIDLKGHVASQKALKLDSTTIKNTGQIETNSTLETKGEFTNLLTGRIKAKSLPNALSILKTNEGKVEVTDSISLDQGLPLLKGMVSTEGRFDMSKGDLTLEGHLIAHQGSRLNVDTFTNKGKLSVFGSGLEGKMTSLTSRGKLDLSHLKAEIDETQIEENSAVRIRGGFDLKGKNYLNKGTVFTCGVHRTDLSESFKDEGTFYSPTLFLLKAKDIEFAGKHHAFLKDALSNAARKIKLEKDVGFEICNAQDLYVLQFTSQDEITFGGSIEQKSNDHFPSSHYFTIFGEKPTINIQEFNKYLRSLAVTSWDLKKTNAKDGGGISLIARNKITYEKGAKIRPQAGSTNLVTEGVIQATGAQIAAGYFSGNHTSVKGKEIFLSDTTLQSYFGKTSVFAERTSIAESHLKSKSSATEIIAKQSADVTKTTIEGQSNLIDAEKLSFSMNRLMGEYNRIQGKDAEFIKNEFQGLIDIFADTAKIDKATSNNLFNAYVREGEISDSTFGSLNAEGDHLKLKGDITAHENLRAKAYVLEEDETTKTKAKNTHLEATQQFIDTANSKNVASVHLSVIAETTPDFKGRQESDTLLIKLQDMNLLTLLNQTKAREMEVHLNKTDVSFDSDTVIDRTLNLWAKSLKNRANLTVTGDFMANIQTQIMNIGMMRIFGQGSLQSDEFYNLSGTVEADDVLIRARKVFIERLKTRQKTSTGYHDVAQSPSIIKANKGNTVVETSESLEGIGAEIWAKKNVLLKSQGFLHLKGLELETDNTIIAKRSQTHQHTLTNQQMTVTAEGKNAETYSGGDTIFNGIGITAGQDIHTQSEGSFTSVNAHDTKEEQSQSSKKGSFGKRKQENRQEYSSIPIRNFFKAGQKVILESDGDAYIQAATIECEGKATIKSHHGKVHLAADKTIQMFSQQRSGKNAVWQRQQQKGYQNETAQLTHIQAKEGSEIAGTQGTVVDFVGTLDQLQNNPQTAWIKTLRNAPNVQWTEINEVHKKWSKKVQGLTPAAGIVLSLAIAIATQGTGATLISGLTTNATIGAMSSAGFTSLVSQASLSLINNQGNISKVFKDLGSKENLRSLATSMASAGIVQGLSSHFQLPERATTFGQHLQKNIISSGTSAGLSMLIHKQDVREALLEAAKGITAGTIGGVFANSIGAAYGENDLNWVTHKLAHGALGAFTGAILGDDPSAGAVAGALGGMVSEIIADGLLDDAKEKAFDQALEKTSKEGRPLEYKDVHEAFSAESRKVANMGRLGAAFAAFGLEQDVNIATRTATNAVENNFIPLVMVGLSVASALYSAYEVYSAYDEAGGGEEGAKAALKELGVQVAINAAGGAAGKSASLALKAILAKNPMLAMVFSKAGQQLNKVAEAASNTKLGQAAFKIEEVGSKIVGTAKDKVKQVFNAKTTVSNHNIGIKWGEGVQGQGMPWEDYLAGTMPGTKLPQNFKTFDFYDSITGVAISAKTLNTMTKARIAEPTKVYNTLKKHIDSAANFTNYKLSGMPLTSDMIKNRALAVAIPKNTTSIQWEQINKAIQYGKQNNIKINITVVE